MGDHLVLCVNRLVTSSTIEGTLEAACTSFHHFQDSGSQNHVLTSIAQPQVPGVSAVDGDPHALKVVEHEGEASERDTKSTCVKEPLVECRICQEEDEIGNLDTPCTCSGSLKYAHRKCVQRWCDEKGDTICEICHQPYKDGYTAPPQPLPSDSFPIDISGNWAITGAHQIDLHDPRIFALEADYDEYAAANESSAACCRSVALILMALLLLRHALTMTVADVDEDASTFFMLFFLRAAGFILPCYIMARAMSMLRQRHQRQEEAVAAAEVRFLLQAGPSQGVRIAVTPASSQAN